jgi:pimeloyl-ACP methyl ester carboxylesterase
MKASQHFMQLASALATEFTVYVPDRRGRGLSGLHGADYSIMREVEDLQALVAATGATRIFGLSSCALVVLRTALLTPALDRVALYEPPLSVNGSAPTDWVPRFDREIAAGKHASALKGAGVEPVLGRLPRFVLVPLVTIGSRAQRDLPEDDVPIAALIPTQHFDMLIVRDMADTVKDYAALDAQVLLLGGTKSPAYLSVALDELFTTLPHARRITFRGLGHSGPEDDGDPQRVGEALRNFFKAAES